jgi:hypothetical protein
VPGTGAPAAPVKIEQLAPIQEACAPSTSQEKLRGLDGVRIGSGVFMLAAIVWIVFSPNPALWLLLLGPAIVACIWPLCMHVGMTGWAEKLEDWIKQKKAKAGASNGKLAKFFFRPLYSGSLWIWEKAGSVGNSHLRAGVRVGSLLYFGSIMLLIGLTVGYIVIGIVVGLIIIALTLWIFSAILSAKSGEHRRRIPTLPLRAAKSRLTTDFFGNPKTDVYDNNGKQVGELRPTTDFLGNPKVDVYDSTGKKIGEQRPTADFLGRPKTDVYSNNGSTVGESRPTTDLLGNPIEKHYDHEGNKVGESRPTTDFFRNPEVKHDWEDEK